MKCADRKSLCTYGCVPWRCSKTLATSCDDTSQLDLPENACVRKNRGVMLVFPLSLRPTFFVSRLGVPGFDKRDAWDNKVHCTIWRLWVGGWVGGGGCICCRNVGWSPGVKTSSSSSYVCRQRGARITYSWECAVSAARTNSHFRICCRGSVQDKEHGWKEGRKRRNRRREWLVQTAGDL